MSKVKQYYTDLTEKQVDDIILSYKSNKMTKQEHFVNNPYKI